MNHLQIFTPILPYVGQLPGELRYGARIRFRGHFREPQDAVHIILQKEALLNPHEGLPLYITIHPGRRQIVRHHLCTDCAEESGQEERVDNCPIECGQDFELGIVPSASGFELSLHGAPLCTFSYRVPLSAARYLFVSSGCIIFAINFENWNMTTSEQTYRPQVPTAPPLQLPRLFPLLENLQQQSRHVQQPQQQRQQQRSPPAHHHQHSSNIRELVLQVLPLVQLAASQLQANANSSPSGSNDRNASSIVNLAHLLPLLQPMVDRGKEKQPKARRGNRWAFLRTNDGEIMPAMLLACSIGLMKLFRFLAIACIFGYIGYVFSRNTSISFWK